MKNFDKLKRSWHRNAICPLPFHRAAPYEKKKDRKASLVKEKKVGQRHEWKISTLAVWPRGLRARSVVRRPRIRRKGRGGVKRKASDKKWQKQITHTRAKKRLIESAAENQFPEGENYRGVGKKRSGINPYQEERIDNKTPNYFTNQEGIPGNGERRKERGCRETADGEEDPMTQGILRTGGFWYSAYESSGGGVRRRGENPSGEGVLLLVGIVVNRGLSLRRVRKNSKKPYLPLFGRRGKRGKKLKEKSYSPERRKTTA